ncbi:hypothetical protein [Nocardiopsis sp. CA-288880]|uniref:hypothetical protein n=1 Tax=Nocardiopsis sp. CA-288880 TaxID=3239995 RepID=UPI003D98763B
MSAQIICQDLRLWDAYRRANLPGEREAMVALGEDISAKALEEDAEPELREIAVEHEGEAGVSADAMIPWCTENTEAANDSSPW